MDDRKTLTFAIVIGTAVVVALPTALLISVRREERKRLAREAEELKKIELARINAILEGRHAFSTGEPITSRPKIYEQEWERGWMDAQTEAKAEQAIRNRRAREEAERIEAERQLQLELAQQRELWEAGEAKLKEAGFYDSYGYRYDLQTLAEMAIQYEELFDEEAKKLQRKLMDGLLYKIERDKFRSISQYLSSIGIRTESHWLHLRDLAARYDWRKP